MVGNHKVTRKKHAAAGFTLIEITIALLILASSLTILLGLQSSAMSRAIAERGKQEAMLAAREIMTALEIDDTLDESKNLEGTVEEVLNELRPTPPEIDSSIPATSSRNSYMRAQLTFTDFTLPVSDKVILQRADLSIRWGEGVMDHYDLTYIAPKPP